MNRSEYRLKMQKVTDRYVLNGYLAEVDEKNPDPWGDQSHHVYFDTWKGISTALEVTFSLNDNDLKALEKRAGEGIAVEVFEDRRPVTKKEMMMLGFRFD